MTYYYNMVIYCLFYNKFNVSIYFVKSILNLPTNYVYKTIKTHLYLSIIGFLRQTNNLEYVGTYLNIPWPMNRSS